jgi:hypothetical protein
VTSIAAGGGGDNTFRGFLAGLAEGINDGISAGLFGLVDVLWGFSADVADWVDVADGSVIPYIVGTC